jgi:hypothetical protein
VTWVEKDKLIALDDSSDYGKRAPAGASAFLVGDSTRVNVKPLNPLLAASPPLGYSNYLYTGVSAIWPDTGFGKGSVVAVVDTGTACEPMLAICPDRRAWIPGWFQRHRG